MTRRRLDAELVRRRLVRSRAEAQEAVQAGLVTVGGVPATKSATLVDAAQPVHMVTPVRPFVSRGGAKLAAAIDRFRLSPSGAECLDAGASTGGFTDCLLRGGAARVVAVDVGYGQLAWAIRNDPRVIVLERTNIRDVMPDDLPSPAALVVADLSFVSLRPILPSLTRLASSDASGVLLVKPQFEAGPGAVDRRGVVRDPTVWRRVLEGVIDAALASSWIARGLMASPLTGPAGNVEFLLHISRSRFAAGSDAVGSGGSVPSPRIDIDSAIAEGEALRR